MEILPGLRAEVERCWVQIKRAGDIHCSLHLDHTSGGVCRLEEIMQREKVKEEWNRMAEEETAYDVDKVVEELEEMKTIKGSIKTVTCRKWDYGTVNRAIEIVKQGGVSGDVREWKSASDGEFIQNPHTKRLHSNEPSMKNMYCNTCRKKIKVVE